MPSELADRIGLTATYGDGGRWSAVLHANRHLISDPDILPDGITLTLPDPDAIETVTVRRGDNLWTISRDHIEADLGRPVPISAEDSDTPQTR